MIAVKKLKRLLSHSGGLEIFSGPEYGGAKYLEIESVNNTAAVKFLGPGGADKEMKAAQTISGLDDRGVAQ